jgi:hypothetical protein
MLWRGFDLLIIDRQVYLGRVLMHQHIGDGEQAGDAAVLVVGRRQLLDGKRADWPQPVRCCCARSISC